MDRLDKDQFRVFSQETGLDAGLTDGRLTAYAEISDVRVGDMIDYEFSWTTYSKLWPADFFREFSVEWSVPVGRVHERFITPFDKPLAYKSFKSDFAPAIVKSSGVIEYVWEKNDPPPVEGQADAPVLLPRLGKCRGFNSRPMV